MGIIIKDSELKEIRTQIQVEGSKVKELWDSLKKRVERYTKYHGIVQPDDTKEWWHIFEGRIDDIAFVQAVEPSEKIGAWLHDVILDVCRKPVDEWIGPVYRKRVQTASGPVGYLETSQLGIVIATAADLCPELFSEEEHIEIKENLRIKSQIPCRNFLDLNFSEKKHLNNFFMVLLNGYGTISVYLDDQEAIKRTIKEYAFLTMFLTLI